MEQMFECYYPMTAPPGESIRINQIRLEYNVVQLDIQPLSAVVVLAYFNFFFLVNSVLFGVPGTSVRVK